MDLIDPRIRAEDYIRVVAPNAEFHASRGMLRRHGPRYEKAFETGGDDHASRKVDLTAELKDEAEAYPYPLSIYLLYLQIGYFNVVIATYDKARVQPTKYQIDDMINVYLIASTLEDPKGQDDAMDAILAIYIEAEGGKYWVPGIERISRVYEKTAPGSALRKFFVDVYLWAGKMPLNSSNLNHEFLQDLITALDQRTSKEPTSLFGIAEMKMCMYTGKLPGPKKKTAKKTAQKESSQKEAIPGEATQKEATPKEATPKQVVQALADTSPSSTLDTSVIPSDVKACDYHIHGQKGECGNKKRKRALEDEAGRDRG